MKALRGATATVAILAAVALAGCSDIREGTDNRAERGIVLEAQAAKTLLQDLAARSTGPITAESLIDSQTVAAVAITQEERDALGGGGERVAFGLTSSDAETTVDVFVQSRTSTSQGLSQASAALFGCMRMTVVSGSAEATMADIDCPAGLGAQRVGVADEVSIDELMASVTEEP